MTVDLLMFDFRMTAKAMILTPVMMMMMMRKMMMKKKSLKTLQMQKLKVIDTCHTSLSWFLPS